MQKASGVVRNVDNQLEDAKTLAELMVNPEEVEEAAVSMTLERRKLGQDPPLQLNQVAKWAGLQ